MDAALHVLRLSALAHVQFKALGILRLLVDKQGMYCFYSGVWYIATGWYILVLGLFC